MTCPCLHWQGEDGMKNCEYYIAVCDDEQADKEEIAEMTKEVCREEHILGKIACFESARELLKEIKKGRRFDLLLIDVMMPGLDGMELARVLRSEKEKIHIVFISNNRETALQGYEVAAARYLAKPLQKDRLKEAVVFCYGHRDQNKKLMVHVNGVTRVLRTSAICYLEIFGRKTRIALGDEVCDVTLSLDELEWQLRGQGFIRCHKSFLVNCRYIHTFSSTSIMLTDGRQIPVSKHRVKEVRREFFDYMNR